MQNIGIAWGRDRTGLIIIGLFVSVLSIVLLAMIAEGATIHVPSDHSTIQAAVDAARNDDVIRIAAGFYDESIIVDVRVTIEGEGQGATVLHNTDSDILKLTADGTRVGNLTIHGSRLHHGIWLEDVRFCWIRNITFINNSRSVYMENADGCLLSDCSIIGSYRGVRVQPDSDGNVFRHCRFINGHIGFYIESAEEASENNTLVDCEFRGYTSYTAIRIERSGLNTRFLNCTIEDNLWGVHLLNGRNTTFIDCTISNNDWDGLYMEDAEGLLVRDCTIVSNGLTGINASGSTAIEVSGCSIDSNGFGILFSEMSNNIRILDVTFDRNLHGFAIDDCWNITVDGCTIHNTNNSGATFTRGSSHILVERSTFRDNGGNGIYISGSDNLTVANCTFIRNFGPGIRMMGVTDGRISDCVMDSNGFSGLSVGGESLVIENVDSRNSWYGFEISGSNGVRITSSNLSDCNVGIATYDTVGVIISQVTTSDCENGSFFLRCSGVSIRSSRVMNSSIGMQFGLSNNVTISDTDLESNVLSGVLAWESTGIMLEDTTFTNTTRGSGLDIRDLVDNVTLKDCAFLDNRLWGAVFVPTEVSRGRRVHIENCTFEGNRGPGLDLIRIDAATVTGCTFSGNGGPGLVCIETSDLAVIRCTFSRNKFGMSLSANERAEVGHCSITDNLLDGINITGPSATVGVRVHNCTIGTNGRGTGRFARAGVWLHEYGPANVIEDNLIDGNAVGINLSGRLREGIGNVVRRNLITNSTVCGLVEHGRVKPNLIHLNAFVTNADHAFSPDDNERFDDGELGNYWDDYRERYPDARRVGLVWDTPYEIPPGSRVLDRYPLCFWFDTIPPVAEAGPDLVVGYGKWFTLDGSGSKDNNEIDTFHWSVDLGDWNTLTFSMASPIPRIYQLGTFTATLTVTDVWGNSDTDTTTVKVVDYEPPSADAGPDLTVGMDELFDLDGSRSWDNVAIALYNWSIEIDGQRLERTTTTWTLSLQLPGVYWAILTVTDVAGNTGEDVVNITVLDTEPPHAVAGDHQRVDQGTEVTFDGTASWDNVAVASHTWYLLVGTEEVEWNGPTFSHTFLLPGRYEARLVVFDTADNRAEDTVSVRVADTLDPIAVAGDDVVVDQHEDFLLDGGASSDNVGITEWRWSYDIGDGTVNVTDTRMVARVPDVGTYVFTLRVEDREGNWAEDSVVFRVRDSTSPVAEAGVDVTVEEGTTVMLASTGSRDNVGVTGYLWTFEYEGETVELEGAEVRFEFGRPGTYRVTLTVEDGEGNMGVDRVTVEVTPVDVLGTSASYLLLLAVVILIVVIVLFWMRPKED